MRKEEEERNPEKCEDLDGSWSDDTEDGRRGERGGKTDAAAEKDAACDAIVNTRQCVKCSTERLGAAISSRVPVFEFCAVSRVNLLFYFEGQTGPF